MKGASVKNNIRRDGEEGVALILVLMLILLLSVIVAEFSYEAQVEASLSGGNGSEFAAYLAAKSAVAAGFAALHEDTLMGQMDNYGYGGAGATRGTTGRSGIAADQLEPYDGCNEAWYFHEPLPPMNGAEGNFWISDESGKLNINALVDRQGRVNEIMAETLRYLLRNMQADETIVEAVEEHLLPGSSTLAGGDAAVLAGGADKDRNKDIDDETNGNMNAQGFIEDPRRLFTSVEEMLLIPGVTPQLYFDLNEPEQQQQGDLFGEQAEPHLSFPDLFTVHGDPSGGININTVQVPLLEALIEASGIGSPGEAPQMVSELRMDPARTPEELAERFGLDAQQLRSLKFTSSFFRIQGDGWVENTMVRIETFVVRNEEQILAGVDLRSGLDIDKKRTEKTNVRFNSNNANDPGQMEAFKILDWRVIR